jgi:PAS domain S-box-containing protein
MSDAQAASPYIGAILQAMPTGVLLVDKETRIRFVNPAFREMFHCKGEELLGRRAEEFVHSDCFEQAVTAGGTLMIKENIPDHDVSFRVGLFPIEGEDLFCGISSISPKRSAPRSITGISGP